MYIRNDIAYAGYETAVVPQPVKVCGVRPLDNYKLWLRFQNGETKIFDFDELLSCLAFVPLKNKRVFDSVYIDYGTVVWNDGEIDIAPEYLYDNGKPVGDEEAVPPIEGAEDT